MKVSNLTQRERKFAERIGNGKVHDDSDAMVLAVGFVIARRKDPVVHLGGYLANTSADDIRDGIEFDVEPPKRPAKKAAKKAAVKKAAGSPTPPKK